VSSLAVLRLIQRPAGKITGGEVIFDGQDLLKISVEEMRRIRGGRIAMVFQDPMSSLNPVLTIGRQIDEAQLLHKGVSKTEARDRTVELLDRVGIPSAGDRANDYPHQLSSGMQQRAMIAMAISCEPRLLIADEPTTALDVTIQAQAVGILQPDILLCGGATEMCKIAALAQAHMLSVATHNPFGGLSSVATAHFGAATPNFVLMESPQMVGPRAEARALRESFIDGGIEIEDGYVKLPTGPGWGVRLNEAVVAEHVCEDWHRPVPDRADGGFGYY